MRVRGGKLEIRKKLRRKSAENRWAERSNEPTLRDQGWGTPKRKKRKD
jgi:hypothetical protein